MDELGDSEEIFASAVVLRRGFFIRVLISALAGVLATSVLYAFTALAAAGCMVAAVFAFVPTWIALGKIWGPHPFVSVGRIALTNQRIVALRAWSYEVTAQHGIAEYESHLYREGFLEGDAHFALGWPSKMEIHFRDGDAWRVWGGMGSPGISDLAAMLTDLTTPDWLSAFDRPGA